MSGINILRRDGVDEATFTKTAEDKHSARRNAFEANLALQLERALGGDASLSDIEEVTKALGAAHQKMTHAIDARTAIGFGIRRYVVLQFGWTPRTGDQRLDALDPFAVKLMGRLPKDIEGRIEPRVKAIGAALSRTEISRRHPLDWRLRWNTPWIRFYLNFLSGKDKRDQFTRVSHNRRKPVNEKLGLCVLLAIAGGLALLGACLIAGTLWALIELLTNQGGRNALSVLFESTLAGLTSYIASIRWLM